MTVTPKLTTIAACRVAGLNRDRFNEHVAAGHFGCAPQTVAGRARLFDPDDMIALVLFRELMEDGLDARAAGRIACEVAASAKEKPHAKNISYIEPSFGGRGSACPTEELASPSEWSGMVYSGREIRKVTTFRVDRLRRLIAEGIEEERSIIGPAD